MYPAAGEAARIGPFGTCSFCIEPAVLNGLAYHSQRKTLYGIDSGATTGNPINYLWKIDPETGQATPIGPTGFINYWGAWGLAYADKPGRLYAATGGPSVGPNYGLYTLDPKTAEATLVGDLGLDCVATRDLAYDATTNKLYLGTEGGSCTGEDRNGLNVVDMNSGRATFIGPYSQGELNFYNVYSLEYDPIGQRLLGINCCAADGSHQVIEIDVTTGAAVQLTKIERRGELFLGLVFVPDRATGKK
jgi:hypothetical protein